MSADERQAFWKQYFQKPVDPAGFRELVDDLISHRQFEAVINCLEQSILSGQIETWTHQVLALAMQAAGRPKAQIERVLLSSQDVMSNDAQSMMVLAAYLVRFDRPDRAVELYRQAAAIDPSRPEAYILALELSTKHRIYSGVLWSAPEVLTFSWTRDRESLQRLAERSAAEAIQYFVNGGDLQSAVQLQTAMQNARQVDLLVRLEWNGQGDLDLSVVEPGGTVCSMKQPITASGGIYGHDGFGPIQANCYEEYICPQGFNGEYRIVVKHSSGTIVGKRARIMITRNQGSPTESTVTETISLGADDQVMRISMTHGRRQAADPQSQSRNEKKPAHDKRQPAYLAQLSTGGGQAAVGNRAVGYTPVVTTLDEGIRMGAMATVSGDRRYVRISVQPMFSTITDVFTFTPVR